MDETVKLLNNHLKNDEKSCQPVAKQDSASFSNGKKREVVTGENSNEIQEPQKKAVNGLKKKGT